MPNAVTRVGTIALAGFAFVSSALGLGLAATVAAATQTNGATALAEQPADEIERFCGNIADAARDRRYALQEQQLENLRKEIDERIARLEEKRAEYEEWLTRRERFMAQAEQGVVQIYAKMRAEAAAAQLTQLRPEMAASILMKLDTRIASVILNEMDNEAAAMLTTIMVSAARPEDPS